MNKELPCYIISDLLPSYQDDILSEQTKKDIDKHLNIIQHFIINFFIISHAD